jgi:hypothetical protein
VTGDLEILLKEWGHTPGDEDGNLSGIIADRLKEYPHEIEGVPAAVARLIGYMERCFTRGGSL